MTREKETMTLTETFNRLFQPSVDGVVNDFTKAVQKLESLVGIHSRRFVEHTQEAKRFLDSGKAHQKEAERAASIAANLNKIIKV
jgi:hypothetical protein